MFSPKLDGPAKSLVEQSRAEFAEGLRVEAGSLSVLVNPTLTLPNLGEGILVRPPSLGVRVG